MDWFLTCCGCTRVDLGTDASGHDASVPAPCAPSQATRTDHLQNLFAPQRKECEVAPLLRVKKRSNSRIDTFSDPPSQAAASKPSRTRVVEGFLEERADAEAHRSEFCPTSQLSPRLEALSADENSNKSALPEVEAEWGTGTVRVMVACTEKDHAAQLDQWCRRCGIVDVTRLDKSEELELTISDLFRRCQPGDTCVMLLEASAGVDVVGNQSGFRLEALPLYTTIVSISDAPGGAWLSDESEANTSLPGQCQFKVGNSVRLSSDRTFVRAAFACYGYGWVGVMDEMLGGVFPVVEATRPGSIGLPSPDGCRGGVLYFPSEVLRKSGNARVVQLQLGLEADVEDGAVPGGRRTPCGFCGAMLRAFEALSLADGPCSLSCSDFFAELEDQARDIAVASGLKLQTTLHEHPDTGTADCVCWPIAAKPREMAKDAGSAGAPRLSTSATAETVTLSSAVPQQRERQPQCGRPRRTRRSPAGPAEMRTSIRREQLHQHRAMPSNLGSLSKMLTGGAISEFQRNSATPELLTLATESDGRRRTGSVGVHSGSA